MDLGEWSAEESPERVSGRAMGADWERRDGRASEMGGGVAGAATKGDEAGDVGRSSTTSSPALGGLFWRFARPRRRFLAGDGVGGVEGCAAGWAGWVSRSDAEGRGGGQRTGRRVRVGVVAVDEGGDEGLVGGCCCC